MGEAYEEKYRSKIDREVERAGLGRGVAADHPGKGRPLPRNRDGENWWLRSYLERKEVPPEDYLPTSLALRREIDHLDGRVDRCSTEDEVRGVVDDLNRRVRDWLKAPTPPQVKLAVVDIEKVITRWRERRSSTADAPQPARTDGVQFDDVHGQRTPSHVRHGERRAWWARLRRPMP